MANFRADTEATYRYGGVPASDSGVTTEVIDTFVGESVGNAGFGLRTGTVFLSADDDLSGVNGVQMGSASTSASLWVNDTFVYVFIDTDNWVVLDTTPATISEIGGVRTVVNATNVASSGTYPSSNTTVQNIIQNDDQGAIDGVDQLTDTDGLYITGNQGEGTVVSLTGSVLLVSEDADNVFDTDAALYQKKRALMLHDSDGDWKGFAYIAQQNADSGSNKSFTLDNIVDDLGNNTSFLNHKGESITPKTTDTVALTGHWNDISSELGDDFINNGQYIGLNRILHMGNIVNADHTGVAFFAEGFSFTANYRDVGNGRLRYGSGPVMFGRVTDYRNRFCAAGADVQFNYIDNPTTSQTLPDFTFTDTDGNTQFMHTDAASDGNPVGNIGTASGNTSSVYTAAGRFLLADTDGNRLRPSAFGETTDDQVAALNAYIDNDWYITRSDGTVELFHLTAFRLRGGSDNDILCQIDTSFENNGSDNLRIQIPGIFESSVDGAIVTVNVADTDNVDTDDTITITSGSVADGNDFNLDKIITGFNTTSNTSSGYGSIALWWSGNVITNTNRVRFIGFENGDPDATNSTFAASNFFNIRTNCDIYSGKQGTNYADAVNGYGGAENNLLVNPYIDVFAENAVALRYYGTLVGGTILCTNAGDGTGQSLAALGINSSTESSQTSGSASNVYTNAITVNPSGDATLGIRANGAGNSLNNTMINFNTTSRIQGKSNTLSSESATGTTTRWENHAIWHNLNEGTHAYLTYDTEFGAGTQSFGGFSDSNFVPPVLDDADSNGQTTIIMRDSVVQPASGNSNSSNNTDFGYFDVDDTSQDSTTVTYSLKSYGYNDIVVKEVGRQTRSIGGLQPRVFPIEANIDTDSLGGGLDGAKWVQSKVDWLHNSSDNVAVSESTASTQSGNTTLTYYNSTFTDSDVETISVSNTSDVELLDVMAGVLYQTGEPADTDEGETHRAINTMDSETGWYYNPDEQVFESKFNLSETTHVVRTTSTGKIQVTSTSTDQGVRGFDVSNDVNHRFDLADFVLDGGIVLKMDTETNVAGQLPNVIGACTLQGMKDITGGNLVSPLEFTDIANTNIEKMYFKLNSRPIELIVKGITDSEDQARFTGDSDGVLTFVYTRSVTFKFDDSTETFDKDKLNLSWAESTSSSSLDTVGSTFNDDTDTKTTIDTDTAGEFTVNMELSANDGKAFHYWIAMTYDGHKPILRSNQTDNLTDAGAIQLEVEDNVDFTVSDASLDLSSDSEIDLRNVTITKPTSDTTNFIARFDDTDGLSRTNATTPKMRYWFRKYVIDSPEYLESLVSGYIPIDTIVFTVDGITTSLPDRFKVSHATKDLAYKANIKIIDTSVPAQDVWDSLTVSQLTQAVQFNFTPEGSTAAENINGMAAELDRRLLTKNTVTNIGLLVPAVDADGTLQTDATIST